MKSLRALKAAGLILAAVVLGLMTVQGSYALWNAVAPANAGTIQAADFKVKIGDSLLSPDQEFPLPAVTLGLSANKSQALTEVLIAGTANVTEDSPFRSITTVTVNPAASPLLVGVTTAVNGICPTAATDYKVSAATQPQATDVDTLFCFRTALQGGTTNTQLGAEMGTTATVEVAQVPFK